MARHFVFHCLSQIGISIFKPFDPLLNGQFIDWCITVNTTKLFYLFCAFFSENKKELRGENESYRRNALYLIRTERNLADIDTTDKAHPNHI